ncbi:hypothetical protein CSE16_17375 [Solibacillus sp. R5-41]|uniref:hypothetical protein n=1 Tax=Solibacillus sp. R5-41 TaxID=2048654 RepID=UPI000C12515F|nr:hypothetical protein [Solibacillus sp. R5-41]ATP41661.1 hypothetical protein CSE16_17375 [Solibacillus sp. R5-41]
MNLKTPAEVKVFEKETEVKESVTLCIFIALYFYIKTNLITIISVAIRINDWIYIGLVLKLNRKNRSYIS